MPREYQIATIGGLGDAAPWLPPGPGVVCPPGTPPGGCGAALATPTPLDGPSLVLGSLVGGAIMGGAVWWWLRAKRRR